MILNKKMTTNITHLVLSGGGLDGFKTLGALQMLKEHGMLSQVSNVIGSSVGTLIGLLYLCDIDESEIKNTFRTAHNTYYNSWNIKRLLLHFTLFDTNHFVSHTLNLVRTKLQHNEILSFKVFYEQTGVVFTVVASNLSTANPEYFNVHTSPDMDIETAICMSCAIPLVFPKITYRDHVYVDGCFFEHFPIGFFLRNGVSKENIIGINLCTESDAMLVHKEDKDVIIYILKLLSIASSKFTKQNTSDVHIVNVTMTNRLSCMFVPLSDTFADDAINEGRTQCEAWLQHFEPRN